VKRSSAVVGHLLLFPVQGVCGHEASAYDKLFYEADLAGESLVHRLHLGRGLCEPAINGSLQLLNFLQAH
jgi:hypothetical protein